MSENNPISLSFDCQPLGRATRIQGAAETHTGLERDHNEDFYGADPERGVFIVADGLGGHNAGEYASRMAVEEILAFYQGHEDEPSQDLDHQALYHAHYRIKERSETSPAYYGMGTTVVLSRLAGNRMHIYGVGDSSVYLLRDSHLHQRVPVPPAGVNGLLQQLLRKRSGMRNIVTSALGPSQHLEIDSDLLEVQAGDVFLMCSDGLTNMISDEGIQTIIQECQEDLSQCCQSLIQKANEAGGIDNITGMILHVKETCEAARQDEIIPHT